MIPVPMTGDHSIAATGHANATGGFGRGSDGQILGLYSQKNLRFLCSLLVAMHSRLFSSIELIELLPIHIGPIMNGIRYNADNVCNLKPFTHESDQISKARR